MTSEEVLKKSLPPAPYWFEQTGIAEIAPRPTELTFDILKRLYAAKGPISRVYSHHGIKFFETDFLKIIGNQLYIDRELELKALLPAYSYFSVEPFAVKAVGLKGFWNSFNNSWRLQLVKNKKDLGLWADVEQALQNTSEDEDDFTVLIGRFIKDYALIFSINFLADKSINSLSLILKKFDKQPIDILASPNSFYFYCPLAVSVDTSSWKGNSLDLSDETEFGSMFGRADGNNLTDWWGGLSGIQKTMLIQPIETALFYNDLRELGRWLAVKHINRIRRALLVLGSKYGLEDTALLYHATLDEINNKSFSASKLNDRRQAYLEFNNLTLPTVLRSDKKWSQAVKYKGLSPGKAKGRLVMVKDLKEGAGDFILYTSLLTPDLLSYFNSIKGIVSEKGSALSHLAILAREKGLPVVTGVGLENGQIKIGDLIELDGSKGTVDLL